MTVIIGLTGGICSGKTTTSNFLKKNKIPIHDSDKVVNELYKNPKTNFLNLIKKINLSKSIKNKKINKKIIRDEIFKNQNKKTKLEKFIHKEVRISRNKFLKKHKNKKTKVVILDIPLLFEAKLNSICDYVILLYVPNKNKIQRALKRKGMNKKILQKIIKNQIKDSYKKKKSDFVINTLKPKKQTFKMILETINNIVKNNA